MVLTGSVKIASLPSLLNMPIGHGCMVGFEGFAPLAGNWLICNDPQDMYCQLNWLWVG